MSSVFTVQPSPLVIKHTLSSPPATQREERLRLRKAGETVSSQLIILGGNLCGYLKLGVFKIL